MHERRMGFTLIELLVAIVMGGVMATAVYRTVLAQHAINRHHTAVVTSQQATRASLEVLATELREISATGGDLVYGHVDRVDFRAFRKLGFVCETDINGQRLDVWVVGEPFAQQDSIVAYAQRPAALGGDWWRRMRVQGVDPPPSCPDWNAATQRLRLSSEDSGKLTGVLIGAPLRGFTRVSYRLSEIDGQWVLARQGQSGALVPMLGPLRQPGVGGLVFRYFDENGAELIPGASGIASPDLVARIEMAAASRAAGALGTYSDSLVTQVFLRGNAR